MAEPEAASRPSANLPFRVRVLIPLLLLLLGYASLQLYGRVPERAVVELSGAALGTTWSVKLADAELDGAGEREAADAVARRLARVDALMSTWRDDSELSRFNASRVREPVPLSPETFAVVEIALAVSAASQGAFDVTVGPLVEAWGFGRSPRRAPPDPEELARLRARVGWRRLELHEGALAKQDPELSVDLSAVAKGYAVDEIARALEALGFSRFLVEVGGELRARGVHPDGRPWRVAIELPDAPERRIQRVVELRDLSMATSGDYRNYYERDGKRLSHTIDPRTGRPIEHALASVTVLHREAAWADAWATALHVLGPEAGYARAMEQGLPAYFIVRTGLPGSTGSTDSKRSGFDVRYTPAFEPHLAEAASESGS